MDHEFKSTLHFLRSEEARELQQVVCLLLTYCYEQKEKVAVAGSLGLEPCSCQLQLGLASRGNTAHAIERVANFSLIAVGYLGQFQPI